MNTLEKPWFERTFLWGQVNLTEDDPEKCDIEQWKAYWKSSGIEGAIINCSGIVSYYQSSYASQYKAAFLGEKDYFGLWNQAAREAGLAVIARMDISSTTKDMYEEHPAWYCRDRQGNPILSQGRYTTCVNGGYYQEFIPEIFTEVIEKYHPDGFADNSWAGNGIKTICYCESCQKRFQEKYGLELPESVDWKNPVYRKWVKWNYDIRTENWKLFNRTTKANGGNDCLWVGMINADPFRTGGRFYDIKRLVEASEFIFCDHQSRDQYCDFSQNAVNGGLLRLASRETIIAAESMAHYMKGTRTFRLLSGEEQEIRKWMLCGISGGISPWVHFVGGQLYDKRKLKASEDILLWHKENREYLLERKNIANIGVIWNQETPVYYGRDDSLEKAAFPWLGMTKALSVAGFAFLPVHADDIDTYADRMQTLVLPNVAILSEKQQESIENWLKQGKNLLITGETGCYDAEGEWKGNPQFYEMLGLTISKPANTDTRKDEDNWLNHENHSYCRITTPEHPIFQLCKDTQLLPFGGSVQKTASNGTLSAPAAYIPAFPIYPPEFSWIREESDEALIYAGELQSGSRVVYLAGDFDRRYATTHLPDYQRILESAVSWCAGLSLPVRVSAQAHINVQIYEKADCYILQLVNLAGSDVPVGCLHEKLPISHITITLPLNLAGKKAYSRVDQKEYLITQKGEYGQLLLPVLEEQELLVIPKQE